jgi:hypothetical protein
MKFRWSRLAMIPIAAGIVGLYAGPAVSQATETMTVYLPNDMGHATHINVGSEEFGQPGDGAVAHGPMFDADTNEQIGQARHVVTFVSRRGLAIVYGEAQLPSGTITYVGTVRAGAYQQSGTWAITGGYGGYEGASGSIEFSESDDAGGSTAVISITR